MDNDLEEFELWHQDLAYWEKMQDSHGRLLGADSMQDLSDEWEDGVTQCHQDEYLCGSSDTNQNE